MEIFWASHVNPILGQCQIYYGTFGTKVSGPRSQKGAPAVVEQVREMKIHQLGGRRREFFVTVGDKS